MMRFSIFENDDTLAGARDLDPSGLLLRDLVVLVSGFEYSQWSPVSAQAIKDRLNSRGWLVDQVTNVSGWLPGLRGFTFRLWIVAGTNYSHAQIQQQIRRDLDGWFNVDGVTIESDSYVPPPPNLPRPPAQSPPRDNTAGLPPANNPNIPTAPGAGNDFLSSFGQGLGISTPIALGGAALLLVLLLRR